MDDAALVLTNVALKRAGAHALSETDISADLWGEVARYVWRLGGRYLPPLVEFRGEPYLAADLERWDDTYNSARLNQTQRVSRVIGALIVDNIKEAGELSDIGLAGLQVRITIRSFNFAALSDAGATPENLRRLGLRVPAEAEVDEVIWYIESGLVQGRIRGRCDQQEQTDHRLRGRVDRSQREPEAREQISQTRRNLGVHGQPPVGARREQRRQCRALHQPRVRAELLHADHRPYDLDPRGSQHQAGRRADLQLSLRRRAGDPVPLPAGLHAQAVRVAARVTIPRSTDRRRPAVPLKRIS